MSTFKEGFFKFGLLVIFVAFFIATSTVTMAVAPEHAKVYYNVASKTYAAPNCISDGSYEDAEIAYQADNTIEMLVAAGDFEEANRVRKKHGEKILIAESWSVQTLSLGALKELGFTSDVVCKNTGAFISQNNSLLVALGFARHPSDRWSLEGAWNW